MSPLLDKCSPHTCLTISTEYGKDMKMNRLINHLNLTITWISGSATTNCFSMRLPKARDIASTPPTLQVPENINTNK